MRQPLVLITLLWTIMLLAAAPLAATGTADTDEVGFSEVVVNTSDTHLLLYATIANAFSEEMVAGLRSGVPIDFSYFVELHRKHPTAAREQLVKLEFRHTLSYDTLKDNFKVELEEFGSRVLTFADLEKAQQTMAEVNGLKILELSQLLPGSAYQLRIRADLFKQTLPLSLHYVMPFVSWWDRKTDWYTLDFSY